MPWGKDLGEESSSVSLGVGSGVVGNVHQGCRHDLDEEQRHHKTEPCESEHEVGADVGRKTAVEIRGGR